MGMSILLHMESGCQHAGGELPLLRQLPQYKFHAIDMLKFSQCLGKKYILAIHP